MSRAQIAAAKAEHPLHDLLQQIFQVLNEFTIGVVYACAAVRCLMEVLSIYMERTIYGSQMRGRSSAAAAAASVMRSGSEQRRRHLRTGG